MLGVRVTVILGVLMYATVFPFRASFGLAAALS